MWRKRPLRAPFAPCPKIVYLKLGPRDERKHRASKSEVAANGTNSHIGSCDGGLPTAWWMASAVAIARSSFPVLASQRSAPPPLTVISSRFNWDSSSG